MNFRRWRKEDLKMDNLWGFQNLKERRMAFALTGIEASVLLVTNADICMKRFHSVDLIEGAGSQTAIIFTQNQSHPQIPLSLHHLPPPLF